MKITINEAPSAPYTISYQDMLARSGVYEIFEPTNYQKGVIIVSSGNRKHFVSNTSAVFNIVDTNIDKSYSEKRFYLTNKTFTLGN